MVAGTVWKKKKNKRKITKKKKKKKKRQTLVSVSYSRLVWNLALIKYGFDKVTYQKTAPSSFTKKILKVLPHMSLCKQVTPGTGPFWSHGYNKKTPGKGPLDKTKY